jgi:hypothetical protein
MISAIQKAASQPRFAQYFVSGPDAAMTGNADVILVEGTAYTYIGPNYHSSAAGGNPVLDTIKAAESQGTGKCESAGTGKVRGASVDKIRYTGPLMGKTEGGYTVWVEKSTGLPLYHEDTLLPIGGGVAWKYGNGVQAPANAGSSVVDFAAILKGLPNVMNAATGGKKP